MCHPFSNGRRVYNKINTMKKYDEKDIEFAGQLLTDRKSLDNELVREWLDEREHLKLLDELVALRDSFTGIDFGDAENEEFARLQRIMRRSMVRRRMLWYWVAAASVVLVIGFAGYWLYESKYEIEKTVLAESGTFVPKTELILATGETVELDKTIGLIGGICEAGIQNDSFTGLDYSGASVIGTQEQEVFNTLKTPVGGFYTLHLEDGTKVWLNAVSEFRYPVAFGGDRRKVYLSGEAYFEVAHHSDRPFIVVSNGVEIKVYGTEFNVNTYQSGTVRTVLVKGSVGVRVTVSGDETMLRPDQMAEYSAETESVCVSNVDPYVYTAWRKGEFVFERETIEEIMGRLSRWYDVEVFYSNETVKQKRFTGVINRYENIRDVLRLIEGPSTLHFELKGRTLLVNPGK